MKKFNHAFGIDFSIDSDNDEENVTADELKAGLAQRLADLLASDPAEIIEACGMPYDTYENYEDEEDQ